MKIIVADTSALISLAVTDMFSFTQDIEFKIPKEVHNELNLIKHYRDKDGSNAAKIIRNLDKWGIEVINIKDKQKLNSLIKDPIIDKGEAESLVLALENKIEWLITDDLKSIQVLDMHNDGNVKIRSSILIPVTLYNADKIKRKQAKQAVIQIGKYRKWNEELFRESLDLVDKK